MSAIIFNGKDAKLLTGRDLLGSDGSVYGKGNEKSYTAGAARATYWGTSGAGITIVDDSTAAELPRPTTTATGLKITGVSGSTAYAYYRFVLDDADANTKLKVQFALKPVSGYASNDFKVDVYSNTASDYTTGNTRLALSTDSSAVTGIPNLTGTFRTTFDAPAVTAKWIEVRIGLNGTNTHACVFSDLIVGPGVVTQGAAVTGWTSYTPTVTNLTLNSTGKVDPTGQWRRVGDTMQVRVTWANGSGGAATGGNVSIGLPSGYTVNTSSLPTSVGGDVYIGSGYTYNVSLASQYDRTIGIRCSSGAVQIIKPATGGILQGTDFAASAEFVGEFTVPVNEWAGSAVNVASNDVEYAASTTGTWDANAVVANTVYGPGGAAMSGTLTTSRTKAVQFVTPIQATDKIYLEYRNATTGIWTDQAISEFPYTQTAPIAFGAGILHSGTTSNSVTVLFNQYAQAGTTFGSATGASNWNSSFYDFWRLRKVSGGQAVGFSIVQPGTSAGLVSASGVPGNATGNSIATGYIGETLEMDQQTMQSMAPTSSTWADIPSTTLALTAGVWMVFARITVRLNSATGLTSVSGAVSQYSNTTATDHVQEKTVVQLPGVPNTNYDVASDVHYPLVVPAGGATLRLKVQYIYSGGTPQARGYICAVRIA